MATVQRYVNTASAGGDGTTNGTSGANAAYASLSSWEANSGGSATDDYIVDCCGTAADTTGVTVDFATNITTGSVTIRGNRSDPAGFYDGPESISSSHYRLSVGNVTVCLSLTESNCTVDGIQLEIGHTGTFRGAIIYSTAAASSTLDIRNNRVRNTGTTDYGIGTSATIGGTDVIRTVENNLVIGFDVAGITARVSPNFTNTWNILHNTVYGDGTADGIYLQAGAGSGSPVFNVKGNAVANNTLAIDYADVAAGTLNFADNACGAASGTTDEIVLGTTTDAWTSPGLTAGSDFTIKGTSSSLYNAVNPTLLTTDITGFTRDGTNHDVGAFEYQSAGGIAVDCGTGTALGAGLAAGVASPITVSAGAGAATAAGLAGGIASPITVAATVGSAVAQGLSAGIASPITISAGVGAASAAGYQADVASGATVSAGVGTAQAAGLSTSVASPITVASGVGSALAAGLGASISSGNEIATAVGAAAASGLAASVASPITVGAGSGAAVGAGLAASVGSGSTVPAGIGAAVSLGLTATVTAETHIALGVGAAAGAGQGASVTSGDGPETYPLAGLSQTYPLAGQAQTYPLQ